MRSRVELFEKIRRDRRLDDAVDPRAGGSSWRASSDGAPGARRPRSRRRGRCIRRGPGRRSIAWVTVIDAWLIADEDAPRKQRHTARRVWQRLVAEHQATLSEVTVSRYVARRRVELGLLTRRGVDPADPSGRRRGRGRLRRVLLDDRRGGREVLDVRDATVPLGQSVSRRVRHPGPGSVPGGPRAGLRVLRRCARPDPVRQPQTRRHPGPQGPRPHRVRTVHRAAQPLRVRLVLLPPGHRGRPREGRCGGRDRPLPAAPPRPGPQGRLAGRAQRADRRR